MQFISIFTWEPGKAGEVREARAAEKIPDGVRYSLTYMKRGGSKDQSRLRMGS